MAAAGREGDSESAAKFESEQQQHQQQQEDRIQTTNVDTSSCLDHNQASHYGPQQEEVADVGGAPQTPSGANRPKRRRRTKEQREEEQQQSQPQEQQQQQYQHQQQKHVASVSLQDENRSHQANNNPSQRPLILITEPESCSSLKSHLEEEFGQGQGEEHLERGGPERTAGSSKTKTSTDDLGMSSQAPTQATTNKAEPMPQEEDQFEVIDGISYRIVAAVTKRPDQQQPSKHRTIQSNRDQTSTTSARNAPINRRSQSTVSTQQTGVPLVPRSKFQSVRRKSSAFVANLLQGSTSFLVPQSRSSHAIDSSQHQQPNRRMSIYEMTKSPPPETSIEMYLNERRRSSTVSAKFVQQQLEQQSTFESNYCARQQYFKDLNSKLINQDKKLLNVVANRGQIHRHSVDIAQLPLFLAQSKSGSFRSAAAPVAGSELGGVGEQLVGEGEILEEEEEEELEELEAEVAALGGDGGRQVDDHESEDHRRRRRQLHPSGDPINQVSEAPGSTISENDTDNKEEDGQKQPQQQQLKLQTSKQRTKQQPQLAPISEAKAGSAAIIEQQRRQQRDSLGQLSQLSTDKRHKRLHGSTGLIVRRFQKFDASALSSAPSPDVKIGQRVAYKEYYGNEFGTIRWIGRVPQISPDWTVGVEFDNAIGEGDGSLNGRRYFIAKDCFAKFLPLMAVALVDQHVGRPEPGTMISVMSAAVRPGQMISIQRVSTVHVQHCFLNAPHRRPGAEFLAVNTRLHCQCPSCGPCAHVVKPPRTQRLMTPKNATHMCQFSTYTCCGMESSDEALCTYTGNRISSSSPPPPLGPQFGRGGGGNVYGSTLPPIGNSWMEGSGYLTNLQAEQRKLMPEEYRLGAAPEDTLAGALLRRGSSGRRRRHGRDPPTDHKSPNDAEIYADHDREGAAGLHSMMASSFSPSSVACDRSAQASPVAAAHLKHQPIAHDDDGTPLQPDDERRRHHHHHKHHHKHHRRANSGETRSKSPPDELLQPDEEGAAVPPPPSCSPVYANLHDHQQQQPIVQLDQLALAALARGRGSLGEAIDMQSERQQQHHHKQPTKPRNQFYEQTGLKNDPDTTQFADDETSRRLGGQDLSSGSQRQQQQQSRDLVDNSEQGAGMAEARDMNRTQQQQQQQSNIATSESMVPCPDNSNNKEDEDQLNAAMATRAVQYRDSIENRYLFPTDDIIDSTLEADLETLSQARYGRFGGAHSSVSNCSSEEESSSRRPWRRGRGRRTKGRAKRTHWRRGGGNSNNNRSSNNKHRTRTARTRGRGGEGGDDYDEDDDDQDDDFDGQQQHLASAMRPNIILKGLRSLVVSCLSANEQHSANTTPTSNNNKSQSSHHYHAHNHHHHQHNNSNHHPPLCNQAYESHDSAEGAATAATAQCCCRYETSTLAAGAAASFGSAGGQSGDYSGPAGEPLQQGPIIASTNTTTTSNEIVASHHQVVDQLNFNKSSRPTGAAYMSWRAEEEAYYMNLDLGGPNGVTNHHQHGYYYDDEDDEAADDDVDHCDDDHSERDRFQEEETVAHQHQRHHHRQHQHRHQHHSRNYHGPRQSAVAANSQPTSRRRRRQDETNESARRQISSSSDCGFSSASQNSMNLTNSNPSCSPTKFSEEEQRRLNQIYKRLAAQLANSATGGTGSEGVAVGGGAGNGANGQHQHHRASATSEDLLRLKRALVAIHSESCCQNSRCTSPLERQNQTGGGGAPVTGSPLAADSAAGKQNHLEESSCLQKARSPSRNDDDQDATHRKGSLARAFELKLTLSINPDPMAQATTTTTTAATLDTKGLTSQQSANTGGDSCQMLDRRSSSRT